MTIGGDEPEETNAPDHRGRHDGTDWRSLVLLLSGNVLFATGLVVHAFLFNFYLRELQLSPAAMGHQVAAMTLGGLCALLPAGVVIDRVGTRAVLLAGVAVTFAGLSLTAIAREPVVIYAAAAVIGLGAATCRVSWGPAIMRVTDAGTRARAFTWNVALLIGSSAGWTYLSGALQGWSAHEGRGFVALSGTQLVLLAGAAVTAAASLCYAQLRLPRDPPPAATRASRSAMTVAPPRPVRVLIALVAFWMLAAALVLPFFNIYFADRFAMPVRSIGATFALAQLATALALAGAAELARRYGARRMLLVWMAALAPALLGLAFTDALWLAMMLYVVQGVIAPATNPLIDQLLLERAPPDRHGVVAGWRNAAAEGAGALGASAAGRLLEAGTFPALFTIAAGVAAASATLLSGALRRAAMAEQGRARATLPQPFERPV